MKRIIRWSLFCAMTAVPGFALAADDVLVPATAEDIQSFDKQMADYLKAQKSAAQNDKQKKAANSSGNFGDLVTGEIKKQKEAGTKGGMGQWVSSQRRKNNPAQSTEAHNKNGVPGGNGRPVNLPSGNNGSNGGGNGGGNGNGNNGNHGGNGHGH